jgi:TetR/AcrR family transcriptional regulator, cholesterol catabolism regulator
MRRDRADDILDAAIELAAEGGFENVRQRDVAARAGVALGTLYKRFSSKEELLAAALARRAEDLERRMDRVPARGKRPETRLAFFFSVATEELCRSPNFARAVLRAMASGVPEVAGPVAAYQGRMTALVVAAMRGNARLDLVDARRASAPDEETYLALLLLQIWYATLVGWSAGLFELEEVDGHMRGALKLLLGRRP